MLKKIVSWISENPPEEILTDIIEESERSFKGSTEVIKTDDTWSSSSLGTQTMEESFLEQKVVVDVQLNNKGKDENLFACGDNESVSITLSDSFYHNIQKEGKEVKDNRNQLIKDGLSRNRNSVQDANLDKVVVKRDTDDLAIKSSSISCNVPNPAFVENPNFEHCPTLDTRRPESTFSHIDVRSGKQSVNKVIKSSSSFSSNSLEQDKNNKLSFVCESSLGRDVKKCSKSDSSESIYGTLFVVGCCKTIPNHLAEKMNAKYILRKRAQANGLLEACNIVTSDVKETLSTSSAKHAIIYRSRNNRSVVTVFQRDSSSDLFQIGRYENCPIDFTVDDINPQDKARHGVSRFACRISVSRNKDHEARIYAGAFNSSQVISLCESSLSHDYYGKMDGFTTNGVLILKPDDKCPGSWKEVSVSGYIYSLRSSTMDATKRPRIMDETNVLIDGTLIDLCGVTLMWRTPEGLEKVPSEYYLNQLQSTVHKYTPEGSLIYRDSYTEISQSEKAVKKAYIYLSCGHVIGLALSKLAEDIGKGWSCPTCRAIGPIKEFTVGIEPGFYFAEEAPLYAAFKPCGHVANKKTVEFWSSINIPNHRSIQCSVCPFCGQKLNFIIKYVELVLPII